ncbi:hypothetical protein [Altericroceibacterium xinjiangense]|uniref:hypothetical protein n=1 Tax=Altericroceibacterium xinjiangense TaxID=762261 RepID=UPI000F7F9073|nr:hypothetical protein [Altericroceibacterium xinjiangense]
MSAYRAAILLTGAACLAPLAPAAAQIPDQVVVNILRECAKIGDPSARLACYDNNIRPGASSGNPAGFGLRETPRGVPATPAPAAPAQARTEGFGADSMRTPERFTGNGQAKELTARVVSAQMRQPGMYLVTLEDGAQWMFTESVPNYYRPPSRGDTVEIERGALGGYLFRYGNQEAARIQRVK